MSTLNCAICQNDLSVSESIRLHLQLPEPHSFHRGCIEDYVHGTEEIATIPCPLCRRDITEELEQEGIKRSAEEIDQLRERLLVKQSERLAVVNLATEVTVDFANNLADLGIPFTLDQMHSMVSLSSFNVEMPELTDTFARSVRETMTPDEYTRFGIAYLLKNWSVSETRKSWIDGLLEGFSEEGIDLTEVQVARVEEWLASVPAPQTPEDLDQINRAVCDLIRPIRFEEADALKIINNWSDLELRKEWIDGFFIGASGAMGIDLEDEKMKKSKDLFTYIIDSVNVPRSSAELKALMNATLAFVLSNVN
jgi:hypothetical protein